MPGFRAVEVWSSFAGEDVVPDDVEGDDNEFLIEESIDGDLDGEDKECADGAVYDASGEVNDTLSVADRGEQDFLEQERDCHCRGEGPAKYCAGANAENTLCCS